MVWRGRQEPWRLFFFFFFFGWISWHLHYEVLRTLFVFETLRLWRLRNAFSFECRKPYPVLRILRLCLAHDPSGEMRYLTTVVLLILTGSAFDGHLAVVVASRGSSCSGHVVNLKTAEPKDVSICWILRYLYLGSLAIC